MKHPPMDGDDDGLAGAWLRYEGSVAEGSLRLRVRAPSAKCTATIAAIALDDCDGLLQAIDGWLQAEVEWQWENEGEAGELRGRPDPTLALAEVDPVEDGTSRSALPPCRLEVPWSVLRRAGAPPLPLAGRLGWHATPALLTLSTMDLEDAELSAIEAGGAVVLPESMQPQWAGWLHLPGEPPQHGLSVAVIRDSQNRTVWDLAREIARLAEATRAGKATREELSGSTITISSLGPMGGLVSTPVINRPEVAIIAVNKVKEMPVVIDGDLEIRKMMNLSLSCDHRVVDGWDAASFIQALKKLLESPLKLLSLS